MANMLLNPGFELGTTSPTSWWKDTSSLVPANYTYIYPDIGRSGTDRSASIRYNTLDAGTYVLWGQSISGVNIDITKTYRLSGYMKTNNIVGGAGGGWAGIGYDLYSGTTYDSANSGLMVSLSGTNAWNATAFTGTIVLNSVLPTTEIIIYIFLENCTGTASFDDLYLDFTGACPSPNPNLIVS